jgi:hypothetical protein
MTIWTLDHSIAGFRPMTLDESNSSWDQWRELSSLHSLSGAWRAPKIRFFKPGESGAVDEQPSDRSDSDTPWFTGGLACVLSSRAAEHLRSPLLNYGELLPVRCDEGEFVIYHCMNQLDDALDVRHSEGGRARDGRLLSLRKPVFYSNAVRGQDIFRIPTPSPYTIFVSDRIAELVRRGGLRGQHLVAAWTDLG